MSAAAPPPITNDWILCKAAEDSLRSLRYIASEWFYQLLACCDATKSVTCHGQWLPVPGSFTITLSR